MAKSPRLLDPLSSEDIRESIEGAGYLVEVALLRELQERGFEASLGNVFKTREGTFCEVDLFAGYRVSTPTAAAHFTLMIEVKRLHDPARFVGIFDPALASPPPAHVARRRAGGVPSNNSALPYCHEFELLLSGSGQLGKAILPLEKGTRCVHWAIAERMGDGTPKASGHQRYAEGMQNVVGASYWHGHEISEWVLAEHISMVPEFTIYIPIIAIDTETLYTYNILNKEISRTGWISTYTHCNVGGGKTPKDRVEVVDRAGFRQLLDTIQQCSGAVDNLLRARATDLETWFERQAKEWYQKNPKHAWPPTREEYAIVNSNDGNSPESDA
ncbi:hypothetical protein [Sorangium sp. So ce117]|uniref:hypothetical protein n=1 Tax=Sorangium sp. So ce117 TaxID=3133277 RepID=UPI003F627505